MKIIEKVKRFWKWYIKGEYHCDKCPYSWEERSYEGDCDCGCYVKGDIQDTCRLLPPFRSIIGNIRKRQVEYHLEHEYDGYAEFHEEYERVNQGLKQILIKWLDEYIIYHKSTGGDILKDIDGNPIEVNVERLVENNAWHIRSDYEEIAHPYKYKSLREEWLDVLKRTWRYAILPILPFLPERKKRK